MQHQCQLTSNFSNECCNLFLHGRYSTQRWYMVRPALEHRSPNIYFTSLWITMVFAVHNSTLACLIKTALRVIILIIFCILLLQYFIQELWQCSCCSNPAVVSDWCKANTKAQSCACLRQPVTQQQVYNHKVKKMTMFERVWDVISCFSVTDMSTVQWKT